MDNTENNELLRWAVLIDADNAPRTALKEIMGECAKYGQLTIKRLYGDLTQKSMDSWKDLLLEYGLTPVQHYAYTTGKNSTDSAMIIDAMDILYTHPVDGFFLVSSDSDFTRLALRLRESGKKVYGIGEKKTPAPFIAACDKFVYVEIIRGQGGEKTETKTTEAPRKNGGPKADKALVELLAICLQDVSGEDGWTFLGTLGNVLLRRQPDFDPRNYGFQKLSELVKSVDRFELQDRALKGQSPVLYVRDKKAAGN